MVYRRNPVTMVVYVYSILFLVIMMFDYGTTTDYPFRNVSLSWKERVDNLVSMLELEEIMYQMAKGGGGQYGGPAPAIQRLGINPYQWDTECLSGDVLAGNATSFPIAIGLAASFSPELIFRVAEATSVEVRAKHNEYVKKGIYHDRTGLSCFSPVINIMRHPLWGRNQETYGEDPFLSGLYVTSFVKGLQGDHPRYVRTNAGCKHFDVHGGPEDLGGSRLSFDASVSQRDWRLTFLPAFKKCVEAGSYSLMCSYNSINGIPSCANSYLLTKILRQEWNFTGYVVSDGGAIENILIHHFYYRSPIQTVTGSINAGCNLELDGGWMKPIYLYMMDAISKSLLMEDTVRERVKPLFYTRMRLGEFDPPSMNPYTLLNTSSIIENDKHRRLSVEAATKSFVLLKNTKNTLPLKITAPKVAILGPMANNSKQLFGDYSADTDPHFVVTPLNALSNLGKDVAYAPGCNDGNKCTDYSSDDVKNTVTDANVIFVCLGTGTDFEAEGKDRYNMDLPGKQLTLLQDAVKYAKNATFVLLLFSGGPVNITWADSSEAVQAIIQCFFPAQATGEALFTALTAKTTTPFGRLPYTWYKDANQIPSMVDYNMKERTYRYFTGEPLYPFGYGLTYTTFNYSNLIVPTTVKAGQSIDVKISVTNTGSMDAEEVVQVYISWMTTKELMPKLQLVALNRTFVPCKNNEKPVEVKLSIEPRSLAVWTDSKGFVIEPGSIKVYVGGQQPNQKKTVPSNILSSIIKINGFKEMSQ